jgi:outer membrane protein
MTKPVSVVLIVALAAAAAGAASAQQPRRVTLNEALRLARENNPSMVQAQQNVRLANMGQLQSLGSFLPSVSANASSSKSSSQRVNQFGTVTSNAPTDNSSFGLSANIQLFTGFQRNANRRAAKATAELSDAALVGQTYATDLATKQAFFNALATQELVGVAETQVRRSQEQLKLTAEKLRLGATTRADSLQASVDYGNAQLQLIQARANAQTAEATLARAIGSEGSVSAVPDTALETRLPPLDTVALRHEALANAPAVVQAEASVAASRASLTASRSSLWPTLSASASQRWAGQVFFPWNPAPISSASGSPTQKYLSTWSVSLSLSYPLFNGFQREAGMVQADANLVEAQARLRDARLLLDANLTQALTALQAAGQQIDVARTSVAAAQENLRMQRERYRLGASTIVDLLTAEVTLNQAEVSLVQARYAYLVARAQLEAYVGHAL